MLPDCVGLAGSDSKSMLKVIKTQPENLTNHVSGRLELLAERFYKYRGDLMHATEECTRASIIMYNFS